MLSRAIVVAAGPIANFLLAMVLFAGLFLAAGKPVTLPVVGEVLPDSAAARAGLLANDRIIAIDGQPIRVRGLAAGRRQPSGADAAADGASATGADQSMPVTTGSRESEARAVGLLGINGGGESSISHVGVAGALWGGVTQTWIITRETLPAWHR